MPTPAQIDEQIALELKAVDCGFQQLHSTTEKLHERSYGSATVYGCASIKAALPAVTTAIEATLNRIHQGHTGRDFAEIHQYLAPIEPAAAAAIALKVIFDRVTSTRDKANDVVELVSYVGAAVEQECQLRWYQAQDPDLLERIKRKYWHSACGTQQKVTVARTMMNRADYHWDTWSRPIRVKLGGWLLDCVIQATGWFTRVNQQRGKKKFSVIVATPEFMAIRDKLMADAEMFSSLLWPMLIEPNDWTEDKQGGYLLNEVMRGHKLIRKGDGGCMPGTVGLAFLNHLQKTAYTLNNFVVEVAEVLMGRGYVVGKFVPIVEMPMPVKPVDIADNEEARQGYRRAAAETMNLNAQAFKRSCRTRKTMNTLKLFKGRERWYLPASFDTRGRCYFLPAYLTPHDTDFGKSLIKFADPAFMNDEAEGWLAFHVATSYGLSKATMAERQEWTKSNHELISRVASNPLEYLSDWEGADDPWQFLAACEEYNATCIECSRQWTNLPVGVDATCSGLQILAAISQDANTARLVNVIPSDRPQDAYKAVAEAAKPKLPEHLAALLDRKVCKKAVMIIPYNGSRIGIRSYIRDALREKKAEFTPDELTLITNAVWDSMGEVVPGAMRVMEWMKREVGNAFKRGADHLEWITPTGFHVFQDRRVSNVRTIKLQILGRCEIQVGDGFKGPDVARHKSSTMPNAIHSLDASLLQAAFLRFNAPFTVIHDCVLCRATEMGQLNRVIRETFYELFADNNFLQYFAEMLGAETEPPIIGDLDLNSVHDSTYFFC